MQNMILKLEDENGNVLSKWNLIDWELDDKNELLDFENLIG